MARFTAPLAREVRLEYLRPAQIAQAQAARPAVYLPVGSLEWHGRHNAIGVDALWAHALLMELAVRAGGVVYPPIFFGAGGEHGHFPNTYMVDDAPMESLIFDVLRGLERDGFRAVILYAGHAPNILPPTHFLTRATEAYARQGGQMRVLPFIAWMSGAGLDHAGLYETSAMMHYHAETVDMRAIAGEGPRDVPEPEDNWLADIYRDHPCYGICKPDPRDAASAEVGRTESEVIIDFLCDWLAQKPATIESLKAFTGLVVEELL